MNEAGNLPINCVFLHNHYRYYVPFRLPSIRNTISQAYTLSLYLSVMGRVSPVPNYTFHTYRFLYTEGFFRAVFQFLHTFHGFRLFYQGSTSLFFSFETFFNDTAEFTLCYGLHDCSHLFQGYFIHSLSTLYYYNAPSLTTRLTGDYRDRTYTGKCSPALLDTRKRKRALMSSFPLMSPASHFYFFVRSTSCPIICCIAFCPLRLATSSFFSFSFARTDSFGRFFLSFGAELFLSPSIIL